MAKIKNPLTVVKGGGTPAVLVTKTITQNGTYAAADETPPAQGYDEVVVDVPPTPIYYSTSTGMPYPENVEIPDTQSISGIVGFRECVHLKSLRILLEKNTNVLGWYNTMGCTSLVEFYAPKLTVFSNGIACGTYPQSNAICTLGSIGYPVTSLNSQALGMASISRVGQGWEVHIYVNATTLAEANTILPYSPWGAQLATIVFHNSTTGEVITE